MRILDEEGSLMISSVRRQDASAKTVVDGVLDGQLQIPKAFLKAGFNVFLIYLIAPGRKLSKELPL